MQQDRQLELILIELISSRICHDLVGPVGAVNAGAELMDEAGGTDDEALALMRRSGQEAQRRLQLFRLAYGRAGNSVDAATMRKTVTQAYEADGKVTLEWDSDTGIDATTARVVLNMIMMAREALPFGGEISVQCDSGAKIRVIARGKRAAIRPEIENVLSGPVDPEDLDPRNIQGFFARNLAERLGKHLQVEAEENSVTLIYV
ncbi:histidine phosphotransferase family protein [Thalassospira marina]|uniref:Histidine phosphotransferase ChpT C-terminal domain-containing protein n=1 Tax=Thalassospira marina TaxID=2048283 RepID=A0A2N3KZ93_9PROT|nr:histidine phosphotransferase family protein [Thalassospira marina]AUG51963.1 hypothetical protein CSC3H3_03945 [Thalassospira marina]PKR55892.1 hypothetical protein COO20_01345 [Thalassospira marina]